MAHKHADQCTYNEMLDRSNAEIVRYSKLHAFEQLNAASENLRAFVRKFNTMKSDETIAKFEARTMVA